MLFLTSADEGKVLLGKSITSALPTLAPEMNKLFIFHQPALSLVYSFANSLEKKRSISFSLMNEAVCIQKDISVIWNYDSSPSVAAQGGSATQIVSSPIYRSPLPTCCTSNPGLRHRSLPVHCCSLTPKHPSQISQTAAVGIRASG